MSAVVCFHDNMDTMVGESTPWGRFQKIGVFDDWILMCVGNLGICIFSSPVEIGSPKMHFDAKCEHATSPPLAEDW